MYHFSQTAPWWAKKAVKRFVLNYRQLNWRNRRLPDFIIIGAMKSGTTSLHRYLNRHPQIIPCYKKEIHFFDGGRLPDVDNFKKGLSWYQAHFPLKCGRDDGKKTFEASPLYIFNPLAPGRIAESVPDVKIIAILRNPAKRAFSHYFHEKRKGREPLSMMGAMLAEEERLKAIIAREDYKNHAYLHSSYKSRGLYYEQLIRYLDYFPMDRMLIINSEKLFDEPGNTLRKVCQFVGIDVEFRIENLRPHNVGMNKTEMEQDVAEYLNNYFYPHNQSLYELVGEDYGW